MGAVYEAEQDFPHRTVALKVIRGITFERYLETLFRRLGYSVQRTRATGDFGADLIVTRAGFKTVIQAKRYHKRIGLRAVQEALAARGMYRCGSAIVVTNSRYTEQVIRLAKANAVELWDRDRLVSVILSTQHDQRNAARRAGSPDTCSRCRSLLEPETGFCTHCGLAVPKLPLTGS
jgi:HJR/Mrr/RecB family endonuclease